MKRFGGWLIAGVVVFVISISGGDVLADVSGSFAVDVALFPEGTQTEAVKMNIDLQSNLILNVTLSGLTSGVDVGFGNSGIEFLVLSLKTILGPIALFDQVIFATPFYNTATTVAVAATELSPTRNQQGQPNGAVFVAARLGLDFDVAGFTVSNLMILEDVDFPNPLIYTNPNYFVNGTDTLIDVGGTGAVNQTPSVGFGDLITLKGQTQSGVTLSGSTGICIQTQPNVIKKRSWSESVDPGCVNGTLAFNFETLTLSGIMFGGVRLDTALTWVPDQPLQAEFTLATSLADALDALLVLQSDNVSGLSISQLSLDLSLENMKVRLLDVDGDLAPDRIFITFSSTLNANQNPANLTVLTSFSQNVGLVFLEPVLSMTRGDATFTTSSVFESTSGNTGVQWRASKFSFSIRTDVLVLALNTGFENSGLQDATISLSSAF